MGVRNLSNRIQLEITNCEICIGLEIVKRFRDSTSLEYKLRQSWGSSPGTDIGKIIGVAKFFSWCGEMGRYLTVGVAKLRFFLLLAEF